jgi:hypothetical protein
MARKDIPAQMAGPRSVTGSRRRLKYPPGGVDVARGLH